MTKIEKRKISSFTWIVSFVALALIGFTFLPLLPVKLAPSQTLPSLTVSFSMPGSAARIVELEATSKLESMLCRMKGIKDIQSTSANGMGLVKVSFDKYVSMDAARFEASAIIRQLWHSMPSNASYPIVSLSRSDVNADRPFLTYTINAPANPHDIKQYTESAICPSLQRIKGIYSIDVSGAMPMQWSITYNNRLLIQHGISVDQLKDAISEHLQHNFLGIAPVEKDGVNRLRILFAQEDTNERLALEQICVKDKNGNLIYLDQLAEVVRKEEEPRSYYRINGMSAVYLHIQAEDNANQLWVADKVKAELKRLKEQFPPGYQIYESYDATSYISKELNKIYIRSGFTILILLLFVLLISRSWKYLLLIVISLAVNLAVALIFYWLLGLEIQLYSLAGITISLSLIIDNTIIMTDHYLHRRDIKVFLSILAATLTTIGALLIIFFLDDEVKLNLIDFASVVIVNLFLSLFIALFFVPALIERLELRLKKQKNRKHISRFSGLQNNRLKLYFTNFYTSVIRILLRFRPLAIVVLILAFGLPLFMLPDKINTESKCAVLYNKIIGSTFYDNKIRPVLDPLTGGALRLFVTKVYGGSYFTRNEEVVLTVNSNMPNGTTLEQMNNLIMRMEAYLSEYTQIRQFQTSVFSPNRATIRIYFRREFEKTSFPYVLRSGIISHALTLSGGSWNVYGLPDQGFSNDVREPVGSYSIEMLGYNYDELYEQAEKLSAKLLEHKRIKEVHILSKLSWWKDDYTEYSLTPDKEMLAIRDLTADDLFATIQPLFAVDENVGQIIVDKESESIVLNAKERADLDLWNLMNVSVVRRDSRFKLSDVADISKSQSPKEVCKVNQQYRIYLQYDYIGSGKAGENVQNKVLSAFIPTLPLGYFAKGSVNRRDWQKEKKPYVLLLIVIIIIFFTTSILFNSLKQPLAVLCVIPVSYIGVFVTFYWFELNFDQGGFASLILLCGLTVNASIYIISEYNSLQEIHPRISQLRLYVKAWNTKCIPIFLTVISTILGFVPFLIGTNKEAFWFPLAVGTIGGLCFSILGIVLFLPLFVLKRGK